jgi:glycosyltransferase involved in cell wall biosynthesis
MSCGLPIVVTNVGGSKYIAEPEFGLQVDPVDVQGIAEAIISILSDKNLRYNMGEEARKKAVEKYDIERVVDRYIYLYKNLNLRGKTGWSQKKTDAFNGVKASR